MVKCLWLVVAFALMIRKEMTIAGTTMSTIPASYCNEHYVDTLLYGSSRWLYGEVPVTGLTNQLTTIYSFLPLSQMLNASLLLGFVYSRANFEISMRDFSNSRNGKSRLQLMEMIDKVSFNKLAKSFGVNVQWEGASIFSDCFDHNSTLSNLFVHSIQRKGWKSSSASSIIKMVQNSGYNFQSSHQNYPQILRFKSVGKLLGLYNFQHDKNYEQLLYIHRNIHPAFSIQERVNMLLSILPQQYIALHARLEPDMIPRTTGNSTSPFYIESIGNSNSKLQSSPNIDKISSILSKYSSLAPKDPIFFNNVAEWINSVLSSSCHQRYIDIGFPSLYIASGMISSIYYQNRDELHPSSIENASVIDRGAVIKDVLAQLGFTTMFSKLDLTAVTPNLTPLSVELEAYIDLEVSRKATCFIPAHLRSSFSYMAQRLRELDENKPKTMIGKPNGAYKVFFI